MPSLSIVAMAAMMPGQVGRMADSAVAVGVSAAGGRPQGIGCLVPAVTRRALGGICRPARRRPARRRSRRGGGPPCFAAAMNSLRESPPLWSESACENIRSRVCCIMLAALLPPMEEIDMVSPLRFASGEMPMAATRGRRPGAGSGHSAGTMPAAVGASPRPRD